VRNGTVCLKFVEHTLKLVMSTEKLFATIPGELADFRNVFRKGGKLSKHRAHRALMVSKGCD
jgi:hypothetical protein